MKPFGGPTVGWAALAGAVLGFGARPVRAQESQVTVTPSVYVAYARHQVDIGSGDEQNGGVVLGATVLVTPTRWTEVTATGYTGSLSPNAGTGESLKLTDVELQGSVFATPWLALQVGLRSRGYTGTFAHMRWQSLSVGGEVREPIFDGAAQAVVQAGLLPVVSVSGGYWGNPNVAATAAVGFRFNRAPLTGAILFSLERYNFPTTSAGVRAEQLSTLRAELGVRFPR